MSAMLLATAVLAGTATRATDAQTANLPTFTAPSRADDPALSKDDPTYTNEPATVIDSKGVRYVANQLGSQLNVTTDGGRTWTHPGGKEMLLKNTESCTNAAADDIGDVELTADNGGRVYMADLQTTVGANADLGIQPV